MTSLSDFKDIQFESVFLTGHESGSDTKSIGIGTALDATDTSQRQNNRNSSQVTLPLLPKETNSRLALYIDAGLGWKTNAKPFLILSSYKGSIELGIEPASLGYPSSLQILSGSGFHATATPVCSNYGGYQNGSYQILGDGRTVTLGNTEVAKKTVQIRGAGPTSLSRKRDGFITLQSAIQEFFYTEAFAQLKIPTTRCLAVMASAFPCSRGTLSYATGNLTRYAPSFLKFGHFEYFHLRGENGTVKMLADKVIAQYYPDAIQLENAEILHSSNLIEGGLFAKEDQNIDGGILASGNDIDEKVKFIGKEVRVPLNRYAIFFRRVVERTAHMVAYWQANGFVHGQMNTEKFSILGLTMDFANSGFMDTYDPQWTSNINDTERRYSFDAQPAMAMWALSRLGLTLAPLVGESFASASYDPSKKAQLEEEATLKLSSSMPAANAIPLGFLYNSSKAENILREITNEFEPIFCRKLGELIFQKLGIHSFIVKDYHTVLNPLLDILASTGTDYVNFFRLICDFRVSESIHNIQVSYQPNGLHDPSVLRDNRANDCMTLVLKSLVAMQDLEAVSRPISKASEPSALPTLEATSDSWKIWAHVYRARIISQLPANRRTPEAIAEEDSIRQKKLRAINPKYCLRSWIFHNALDEVEKQFPPVADLAQNTRRKQDDVGPGAHLPCFVHLEKIRKIIIDDMFGEISDSKSGWKDAEYKELASKWTTAAPLGKSNMFTRVVE